jgi:hypothetical protein
MTYPTLEVPQLKRLLRDVLVTRPDEIDCDHCLRELDRFVEITLSGRSAAEAMPLVEQHLQQCHCCMEEYEALLLILRDLH